jgi:predicted Zn-dependent protease
LRFHHAICLLSLLFPFLISAQESKPNDAVMQTLRQELDRSFSALKGEPTPPYFISYQLEDNQSFNVTSSFGALTASREKRTRVLDIDLRIGEYKRDSSHSHMFGGGRYGQFRGQIPIEDAADALKVALWLETDRNYNDAVQRFEAMKTNRELKVAEEDDSPDFSPAPAQQYSEVVEPLRFDSAAWEEKVRRYGRPFRKNADIVDADITASAELLTRRYVNTDGSEIRTSTPLYKLDISASIRAEDGEILPLQQMFMSFSPEGLPSDDVVLGTVSKMIDTLLALQKAPLAEAYTGPAILSGRASAVFFHEIFGHRIEGARLKNDDDAQTFKKKINQQVLPTFLSVFSDPTLSHMGAFDLVGHYPFDDEGVKARRVTVVDKGIFKSFLMSRSPMGEFAASNAHGRHQPGYPAAARQSNLLIEASQTIPRSELKKKLIERIKAAKKPYGMFLEDIKGGVTFTSRSMPNAFSVMPTLVYRVYPDGSEQLVRGLDLIGTPLIAFSKIVAADNEPGVFDGICGAESGWVPVSAVAPGVLLEQIEVQRKEKSQERKPILPSPVALGN